MLTVQSTCGLDCWREHGVQTDDGWINLSNEFGDLAKVCKVLFLLPGCNEDLNVFCECLDTFSAWRLDGTDPAILVLCQVVVVIESFVK